MFGEGPAWQNRITLGVANALRSGDLAYIYGWDTMDTRSAANDWQAGLGYRLPILRRGRQALAFTGGFQHWRFPSVKTGTNDWLTYEQLAYNTKVAPRFPFLVTSESWTLLKSPLPTGTLLHTQAWLQYDILKHDKLTIAFRNGPAHTYSWNFYGTRGNVGTISRAVLQIGFRDVKSICLCYLLMQLCSDDSRLESSEREKLWKHAFATAKIASEISRRRPWISGEKAYVYGLLHDFGRVAMAYSFNEHYRAIANLAELRGVSPWYVELQYGLTHTTIGRWIAAKWSLPEVFQRVMEFHHQPERSPSYGPEVKLIALADILANADRHPGLLDDPQTHAICRELFITEDEWDDYQEVLTEIRVQVDQFWNLLK